MTTFTPLTAAIGGLMIGFATALFLFLNGRIAGISGILGGISLKDKKDSPWRVAFLAGLILGPLVVRGLWPGLPAIEPTSSVPTLIVAGLLVGFGSRLGSGCTSGHGVCGLARLSPRSITATLTFMMTAAITVYVVRHVVGG